jgi:hypothetical protein
MQQRSVSGLILWAAAFTSGCSISTPAGHNGVAVAPAPASVSDCPPEELSCGLQQPVTASAGQVFVNHEMGLSATFPASSRVCVTRSGNAARGFYALYGLDRQGCPERGDVAAARMAINSMFNAAEHRSLMALADDCRSLPPAQERTLQSRTLRLDGHPTLTCLEVGHHGWVEITVYALAGQQPDSLDQTLARTIYMATLVSRAERFDHDLPMFMTFLDGLRIGIDQPA